MTIWTQPSNITQASEIEEHVQWQRGADNFDLNQKNGVIQSSKPLLHISNDGHAPLKMKTWYLYFTDFKFEDLPDTISGVEARTTIRRKGRIVDDTIQLCLNNELIGENKVNYRTDDLGHLPIYNETSYGGFDDQWGATLTKEMLLDPSFGIAIRLQSHLFYPHKETVLVDSVELRVY